MIIYAKFVLIKRVVEHVTLMYLQNLILIYLVFL